MPDHGPLFPSGVGTLARFEPRCIRCYRCVAVCEVGAIRGLKEGAITQRDLPVIYPARQACEKISDTCTCSRCSQFSRRCACRLCYDICPLSEEAITLDKGTLNPRIIAEGCIGYGLCAQYGPVEAISIRRPQSQREGD